jgi:hypothetical protein
MGGHPWEVSRMLLLLSVIYLLLSVWRALKGGDGSRTIICIEKLDYLEAISVLLADYLKYLILHRTAFNLFHWECIILKEVNDCLKLFFANLRSQETGEELRPVR